MTQITVNVTGDEVLVSRMKAAALAIEDMPRKEIRDEMKSALEQARTYPDELPDQKYIRTFTYFRSFRLTPAGRGYTLASDAQQKGRRYTRYVGGMADGSGQAKVHAGPGRWLLIRDAVLAAVERVRERAAEKFRKILSGGPGGT